MIKKYLLFVYLFSFTLSAVSQQLNNTDKQIVENKKIELSKAVANNDWSEEIRFNKEIADIYQKHKLYLNAIPYLEKAFNLSKSHNQQTLERQLAQSLLMINVQLTKYSTALKYALDANQISIKKGIGKPIIYKEQVQIASLYRKTGNSQKAYELLKPLEHKIIFEAYDDALVDKLYRELAAICKANGDTQNYLKYTNLLEKRHIKKTEDQFNKQTNTYKETVNQKNKLLESKDLVIVKKNQTLASYQDSLEKVEIAKREADYQLEIKQQALKIKQNELEKEKLFSRTLTIGLILMLIITAIISYMWIIIKKSNKEIQAQKEEIEKQNSQLEQKNKVIKKKNDQITAGIRYAKNIQDAGLPTKAAINTPFPAFILHRAKDIVSGDFYWHAIKKATKTNETFYYWAVVDCTGHGVPGAFMSLIGMRLLNEILFEKNIEDPAEILSTLNMDLQKALNQRENTNDDGMDVSLVRIKRKEQEFVVSYCGANRPLIYFDYESKEIQYKRGSIASIGGLEGKRFNESFENINLILNKNDVIYLSSDGFVDQNNPQRKKYGTKRLLEVLNNIAIENLTIQEEILNEELNNHQLDSSQRDDITIMGIMLK